MTKIRHYAILYQDERRTQYTVYESTDLALIGNVYAEMVAFEKLMQTFPNLSCKIYLEEDVNYDPDCGAWSMSSVVGDDRWDACLETITKQYGPYDFGTLVREPYQEV